MKTIIFAISLFCSVFVIAQNPPCDCSKIPIKPNTLDCILYCFNYASETKLINDYKLDTTTANTIAKIPNREKFAINDYKNLLPKNTFNNLFLLTLEITSPETGAEITVDNVTIKGTSNGLAQHDIYMVVHPVGDGWKWVQDDFGKPNMNGKWGYNVLLGGKAIFEIWAIATDSKIKPGRYPSSEELPAHIIEASDKIRLNRLK